MKAALKERVDLVLAQCGPKKRTQFVVAIFCDLLPVATNVFTKIFYMPHYLLDSH